MTAAGYSFSKRSVRTFPMTAGAVSSGARSR
jgi:hypothetical protein